MPTLGLLSLHIETGVTFCGVFRITYPTYTYGVLGSAICTFNHFLDAPSPSRCSILRGVFHIEAKCQSPRVITGLVAAPRNPFRYSLSNLLANSEAS